jgi:hypothetical protein
VLSIRGSVGRLIKYTGALARVRFIQDTARLSISPIGFNGLRLCFCLRNQHNVSEKCYPKSTSRFAEQTEQTEIVRRVDQLFAHADRIEQQVNNALARVNKLTQSILAKAFRGELTEQWRQDHPDLISGENSAEALLERIKAERAAAAPARRTRNAKRRG